MMCDWDALLRLVPPEMREEVDKLGRRSMQELRLRLGQAAELVMGDGSVFLNRIVHQQALNYVINSASKYSPWSAESIAKGYITAEGGHRVGVCGEAVTQEGIMRGIRNTSSLCIRVARDKPGCSAVLKDVTGSILIIGSPGCGKTTLLRDLIREKSNQEAVSVVDERGELFPAVNGKACFPQGKRTDIISGCSKSDGIDCMLRTMGPKIIAVDEITAEADCDALVRAGWCGVNILATAHASCKNDLLCRPIYRSIVQSELFGYLVVMRQDKSWYLERMNI